jgi:hypothetical protein
MATRRFWTKVTILTIALVMPFGILALVFYLLRRRPNEPRLAAVYPSSLIAERFQSVRRTSSR